MRVITGTAKGKRLVTPEGRDVTRPTGEKVKEAIFSSIQFLIEEADVLDLFAGSGQMGLEALSRGAEHATLADQAKALEGRADGVTVNEDGSVLLNTETHGEVIARFPEEMPLPTEGENVKIWFNGVMTMSLPGQINVIGWETVAPSKAR